MPNAIGVFIDRALTRRSEPGLALVATTVRFALAVTVLAGSLEQPGAGAVPVARAHPAPDWRPTAADPLAAAMVTGHRWRYEFTVERAEGFTVWRFRSSVPRAVGSGRTFLRFELECRDFADVAAAENALASVVARAHPDTGLAYAWDLVVQEGTRVWHLRAPCLYSERNFDRLAANLQKTAIGEHTLARTMRCTCGGGCRVSSAS